MSFWPHAVSHCRQRVHGSPVLVGWRKMAVVHELRGLVRRHAAESCLTAPPSAARGLNVGVTLPMQLCWAVCRLPVAPRWGYVVTAVLGAWAAQPLFGQPPERVLRHTGIQDASAGIAIGSEWFVAGDDEQNELLVYRRDQPGPPIATFKVDAFVQPDPKHPEMDIEGVTRLTDSRRGEVEFWITSHGTNASGKPRFSRQALFATQIRMADGKPRAEFVGHPYRGLLAALLADPRYAAFHLEEASHRPPKALGGLNIEGLAGTPRGELLIGFRSPVVDGKALIATLRNPFEVIDGRPIKLGEPLLLDLGGLGIRSFEYWPERKVYVIAAGPRGRGECRLFTWSGDAASSPRLAEQVHFKHFSPEAIVIYPDSATVGIQVLSDDGRTSGHRNPADAAPSFRSGWIRLEPASAPPDMP